jgi:DNA invertase Pin-like site-specific DNA recombinase
MKYGYARVSTDGQSVAAQVTALNAAGATKVFREVASGAKTDRAQLRKAISALGAGDVLMVTRLLDTGFAEHAGSHRRQEGGLPVSR